MEEKYNQLPMNHDVTSDPYFSDLGQFYDILAAIQKRQERTQSTKREKKSTFICSTLFCISGYISSV